MSVNKVFVYGTLKRSPDKTHHLLLRDSKFRGQATVKGSFGFVNLGAFPAVVMPRTGSTIPQRKINGEVYEVDERTLKALDGMEGVPHLYLRIKVPIKRHGECFMYAMPYDRASHGTPIVGSAWTRELTPRILPASEMPKHTHGGYTPRLPEIQWVVHIPLSEGGTAEMQVAAATLWDAIEVATRRAERAGMKPTGKGQSGTVVGSRKERPALLPAPSATTYTPAKTYTIGIFDDATAFAGPATRLVNGGW